MRLRLVCIMILSVLGISSIVSANSVSRSVVDTVIASGVPECIVKNIGNTKSDRTDIGFDLISTVPLIVYKVEWINCDSVKLPLEPFYLDADVKEEESKALVWHINLEFPFSDRFGIYDQLNIHTDKGIIRNFTMPDGQYEYEISHLKKNHEEYVMESEKSMRNIWIIVIVLLALVSVIGIAVFIGFRRRLTKRNREVEELSMMIEERSERNLELREKVNALYRRRLDTLNMLCNGYFDNNDSEKMRDIFYKDVEKQILALRDNKSVEDLEQIINEYLDNTMLRLREQLPELTVNDLKFLAYIYAGFSPRAVCIFMNIKIKTFYNRRNLLMERILASDAKDKEDFVSRMNI